MAIETVITPNVVHLSFAQIVDPIPENAKYHAGKWAATLWFSKDDTDTKEQFEKIAKQAIEHKWKTKPKGKFTGLEFLDGDDEEQAAEGENGEEIYYQEGMWGIRCRTSRKPVVKDKYGNDVTEQSKIGYTALAKVKYTVYPWDNEHGKGLTVSPEAFMITDFGDATSVASDEGFEYESPIDEA